MSEKDVTQTYARKVWGTRRIVLASLIIGLLTLVAVIILWILAYTGHVVYKLKAGATGAPGIAGPMGATGVDGPPGPRGPQGASGPAAPFDNLQSNFQSGDLTVTPTNDLTSFHFDFIQPYTYDSAQDIAQCFVTCSPIWTKTPPANLPSVSITLTLNIAQNLITGCQGVVSFNGTYSGTPPPLNVKWWATNIIKT